MEKKVCTKCKEEKDVTEFNSSRNQCKLCRKEYDKEYNQNNKENIKKRKKEYYQNNKEKFKERHRGYKKNNRERVKKLNANYQKLKKSFDTLFKVRGNISNRIYNSLKRNGYTKNSRTHDILGITFDEFKTYIESQWEEWMNWDNYGKYNGEERYGWDFDHIIPISSGKCEEDIIRLNHHSNLQPLCSYVNRYVKRDKIIK